MARMQPHYSNGRTGCSAAASSLLFDNGLGQGTRKEIPWPTAKKSHAFTAVSRDLTTTLNCGYHASEEKLSLLDNEGASNCFPKRV